MTIREAFTAMIETGEYKNILPITVVITTVYMIFYGISAII
jgi:hypothetical protein